MNKNIYNDLNKLNIDYFEKVKNSIQDPLGLNISNDVNWIKLNEKWNSSEFPKLQRYRRFGEPSRPRSDAAAPALSGPASKK